MEDVRQRKGSQISSPEEYGGWTDLSTPPLLSHRDRIAVDPDNDGLPTDWETSHGLDPNNAADGCAYANHDGYTSLEDYLNSLVP